MVRVRVRVRVGVKVGGPGPGQSYIIVVGVLDGEVHRSLYELKAGGN